MKKDALSIHEHIRLEAFLLSEKAGHPAGMDQTFWVQAEAIVHGRTAVVAGAGKSTKAKAKPSAAAKAAKKPSAPAAAKKNLPAKSKTKSVGKRAK